MFIERLIISGQNGVIRNLEFHKGLNLIVDKTPDKGESTQSGNNVGKTTVLRLIDFCLGNPAASLYQDQENKSEHNQEIKNFLVSQRIQITLVLVDNLDVPSRKIVIERNFLQRNKRLYTIDGKQIGSDKAEINSALAKAILPDVNVSKPTFRQIISHNIRYEEDRLVNTLKTLGSFGSDEDYEALYLFMFGCDYDQGDVRARILIKRDREEQYKRRLEKQQTKGAYKVALDVIENDIKNLEDQKKSLNINPNLEQDVETLNQTKVQLNRVLTDLASLNIRKSVIQDAIQDMQSRHFDEDTEILTEIYKQAQSFIPNLQHTFEDMVNYHNDMLVNRVQFMSEELPNLENKIKDLQKQSEELYSKEKSLQTRITTSDTFSDLENIISHLNELYQKKGSYESAINSITEVENAITELNEELKSIDDNLFSDGFLDQINKQLAKFNVIFADFSNRLYNEQYAIKCDPVEKRGKKIYRFAPIDINFSTGKKQGEISCFDLAYTKFADSEGIPCLHFLLNDKKELVHGNQLNHLAKLAEVENIQFVASILEDKLTPEMRDTANYVVELSENDKLFKF